MLENSNAFSSFSVDDQEAAKQFYGEVLGVQVETISEGLTLKLAGGTNVFVYPKEGHQPATYTTLNFPVDDISQVVDELKAKGVAFEHYDGMTDEKGIAWGMGRKEGPNIAWFKDPAGNILSVLQQK